MVTDGSNMKNILDQSMYLGMSLSRVGGDFRGLLRPIFEKHIFRSVSFTIQTATNTFVETVKSQKIAQTNRSFSSFSRLTSLLFSFRPFLSHLFSVTRCFDPAVDLFIFQSTKQIHSLPTASSSSFRHSLFSQTDFSPLLTSSGLIPSFFHPKSIDCSSSDLLIF